MWNNVEIEQEQIIKETEKGILVKIGGKSIKKDWSFWTSKKLYKIDKKSGKKVLGINNDFEYVISFENEKETITGQQLMEML